MIRKALPGPAERIDYDDEEVEVMNLDEADVQNFGKGGAQSHGDAYDSDGSDGGGGGGGGQKEVQCQQS